MVDKVEGVSSVDSSSAMDQWLAYQAAQQEEEGQTVNSTSSLDEQLEMTAAEQEVTSGSSSEQNQANQNAQDEGFQAPPVPKW